MDIRVLDRRELPGFRPYLLPRTAAALERDESGWIALGAAAGPYSCGAAAARVDGARAELTDLFVDGSVRRQGVGARLLEALTERLRQEGVRELYAGYVLRGEDLAAMDALLGKAGASPPVLRSRTFMAPTDRLSTYPIIRDAFTPRYRTPEGVVPFGDLPAEALAELSGDGSIPEALRWETLRDRFLPDLSVALVRDGRVLAYQLAEEGGGGFVLLSAVSREDAPARAFTMLLVELLNRCWYRAGSFYPLYFSTINDHVERLALRLMGEEHIDYEEHTCTLRINTSNKEEQPWQ